MLHITTTLHLIQHPNEKLIGFIIKKEFRKENAQLHPYSKEN